MIAKVADFGLSRGIKLGNGNNDEAGKAGGTGAQPESGSSSSIDSGDNGEAGGALYYRSQKGVFPVRWTAPESMEELVFTVASDVWSFGIVLVELFQDGVVPYHALKVREVLTQVMAGMRHAQPATCSDDIYALQKKCWDVDPLKRPTFKQIVSIIQAMYPELASPTHLPRSSLNGFPRSRADRSARSSSGILNPYSSNGDADMGTDTGTGRTTTSAYEYMGTDAARSVMARDDTRESVLRTQLAEPVSRIFSDVQQSVKRESILLPFPVSRSNSLGAPNAIDENRSGGRSGPLLRAARDNGTRRLTFF